MSQDVRSQALWLLSIIHLSGQIVGKTRLQKLAFLTNQLVPNIERYGFYDDWKPGKYGPYSPSLGKDVDYLVLVGLLDKGLVESSAGYTLDAYKVTPKGEREATAWEQGHSRQSDMIRKSVVKRYARAPLMSLLHDVYYMAPEYTVESKIARDVFGVPRQPVEEDEEDQ
jgi:uncharacterized protein YwgA